MHSPAASTSVYTSRARRLFQFTVVRIVIAVFTTALAGGLTAQFVSDHTHGGFHVGWPSITGAAVALAAYALYVRLVERRSVSELAGRHAIGELGSGLAGGAALVGLLVGSLSLLGVLRFEAINPGVSGLGAAFAQMVFVGVLEELLMRAVIFRLLERSLGTWIALVVSSLLFGIGHIPGDSAGALSTVVAVAAGGFFVAAYLVTRRLWLPIALHTGWNFTLGSIFSLAVSGHERTAGLLAGSLDGPQWLTGGAYGPEASVLTLVFLLGAGALLLRRAIAQGHVVAWTLREANGHRTADTLPVAG